MHSLSLWDKGPRSHWAVGTFGYYFSGTLGTIPPAAAHLKPPLLPGSPPDSISLFFKGRVGLGEQAQPMSHQPELEGALV